MLNKFIIIEIIHTYLGEKCVYVCIHVHCIIKLIFHFFADRNWMQRGTRAGRNLRRHRFNPYEQGLQNMAMFFASAVASNVQITRNRLQLERDKEEKNKSANKQNYTYFILIFSLLYFYFYMQI